MDETLCLIWDSIGNFLSHKIKETQKIRLLIAPFIKLDALKSLLDITKNYEELQVIVRWTGQDILNRTSDLAIFPYLREKRIPLYHHPDIHLKLYVLDNSIAFHTSGNITKKGLGIPPNPNIEVGCLVQLTIQDWENIFRILQNSSRIDDQMYEKALKYFFDNIQEKRDIPNLSLKPQSDKQFSVLSLPASNDPESLYKYYENKNSGNINDSFAGEFQSACIHDLILYRINKGLTKVEFFSLLEKRFRSHEFIKAIVSLIKENKSARFGLVNLWLQKNCSDQPTPYKWELKKNTKRLYYWLSYFFREISWDRPRHSMVIRWIE